MAMRINVEGAKRALEGIWRAKLSPREAAVFGPCDSRFGDWTVVGVEGSVAFDEETRSLSFDPGQARVLNIGATDEAILLASLSERTAGASPERSPAPYPAAQPPIRAGDQHFIRTLPTDLRSLGESLLAGIRRHFPGELRFHPKSRKYVESPDNFWTVTIQTRVKALQITVRGDPDFFGSTRSVQLKPDMKSYSRFKVSAPAQVEDAISVIRKASTKGRRGAF